MGSVCCPAVCLTSSQCCVAALAQLDELVFPSSVTQGACQPSVTVCKSGFNKTILPSRHVTSRGWEGSQFSQETGLLAAHLIAGTDLFETVDESTSSTYILLLNNGHIVCTLNWHHYCILACVIAVTGLFIPLFKRSNMISLYPFQHWCWSLPKYSRVLVRCWVVYPCFYWAWIKEPNP